MSAATRSWEDIPFGPGPSPDVSGKLPPVRAVGPRAPRRRRAARPRVRVCIRRRRVLASIAFGLLLALALGASGLGAAWWAAVATAAAGLSYLALLLLIRHLAAKREWASLSQPATGEWSRDGSNVGRRGRRSERSARDEELLPQINGELQSWALARFLTAWSLGCFFTPLVLVAQRVAGGAAADSRRRRWLVGCQRLRDYGRQQALKALSLTMVATAGAASLGAFAGGSAAGASPLVPQVAASSTYTAQPGNTLSGIAARYRVSVSALAAENGIRNPNVIFAGQVLHIGGGSGGSDPTSYRVQPGDTLSGLARRFGVSVSALAAENGIRNPNVILAGQVLRVARDPAVLTASASDPAVAPSVPDAALAVRVALAQVGRPYNYGGASPSEGFDCSGLIMYAWSVAGVSIPHYSVSQYDDTIRISEAELRPGDIVFYNNGLGGPQPGHEAMYIGGGQVVASNMPGTDVQVQPLTWAGQIIGFGRVR